MTKHHDLSLANRALLVSLSISDWTARKFDRAASREVTQNHGASDRAARVNKNLLPGAVSLDRVHKKTNEIRGEYYKRTLPWREGAQIIPSSSYIEFTQLVNKWTIDREGEVDAFVADYPELRRAAQSDLGGLFDPNDYPSVADIRSRFKMDVRFEPVPNVDDWRVDVGDQHLARIKADLEKSIEERLGSAMQDAWRRIYEVVDRAKERLSQPDAIFRNSLVENAIELCSLLPSLNVTGDPNLEAMRQAVERSLANVNPDDLRKQPMVRAAVASEMDTIMSRMGVFYRPQA